MPPSMVPPFCFMIMYEVAVAKSNKTTTTTSRITTGRNIESTTAFGSALGQGRHCLIPT